MVWRFNDAELIATVQARAGHFYAALLTLESLPQLSSRRSELLREIVRLQTESSDDNQILDSIDGFDEPICEARVLMGMAAGLAARKHRTASVDAKPAP